MEIFCSVPATTLDYTVGSVKPVHVMGFTLPVVAKNLRRFRYAGDFDLVRYRLYLHAREMGAANDRRAYLTATWGGDLYMLLDFRLV